MTKESAQNPESSGGVFVLDKVECARRQLETALDLFFNEGDEVATHTLAFAAHKILEDIAPTQSTASMIEVLTWMARPNGKLFRDKFNEAANYFKHADRDPDRTIEFRPALTEHILYFGVDLYMRLTQKRNVTFVAFNAWFVMRHPDMFGDSPFKQLALQPNGLINLKRPSEWLEFIEFAKRYYEQQEPQAGDESM